MRSARFGAVSRLCRETLALRGADAEVQLVGHGGCYTIPMAMTEEVNLSITNRQEIMLAALAAVPGAVYEPAQVQKLFFLLDEELAEFLGGKWFDFKPHDYGPFDVAVYRELENLARMDFAQILRGNGPSRRYLLTAEGYKEGKKLFDGIDDETRGKLQKISSWIRKVSFRELISEIYKYYPHMRENSVFQN